MCHASPGHAKLVIMQGRSQGDETGANAPARLSRAPMGLLLAYVESQQ